MAATRLAARAAAALSSDELARLILMGDFLVDVDHLALLFAELAGAGFRTRLRSGTCSVSDKGPGSTDEIQLAAFARELPSWQLATAWSRRPKDAASTKLWMPC